MVELFEQDLHGENRQSSKGNQLKWRYNGFWYKADYTGYEGLTEYMISHLLRMSTLNEEEYVLYNTEQIRYGLQVYLGCKSKNFLEGDWQIITLERLFQNYYGESLNRSLYTIENHQSRLRFLVEQTERMTGLEQFGAYMTKLLTLDTFFLNEDRHTHNIAVLMDGAGKFRYCPIFDNGAGLMSDTTMDYPLNEEVEILQKRVKPKTFCVDFEEQLDIAEELYGQQIQFRFQQEDVWNLLQKENYYSREVKERAAHIILEQQRKYQYLFP